MSRSGLVRNPDYWKPGLPYLDAIEYTIIPNRSTMLLAMATGKFDLTFTSDLTPGVDQKPAGAQAPAVQCELQPTGTQGNLLVNRERPPFDNEQIRKAMVLSIDRKAFSDILSRGTFEVGGANLPPPEGFWGWSKEYMETVPGYGADVEKSRDEGRRIMKSLGYGPDNLLQLKVTTRNIPDYRDAAVILIDHLKSIYIQGELEAAGRIGLVRAACPQGLFRRDETYKAPASTTPTCSFSRTTCVVPNVTTRRTAMPI